MMELQLGARASSTVRKYRAAWLKWRTWALSKTDVPVTPAQPAHVALFITELANTARVMKGLGFSTLEGAAYGIAWAHKMGGLTESPTDHPLVKMTLDGAKRSLSKPIKPKEQLPLGLIQDIALRFSSDSALSVIRFLFILFVGYAGFLRADEILKMKVCDVKIHADHMLVSVPERKNDQYRQGHIMVVIRSNKVTCPVCITEKILARLPLNDNKNMPLVRRIVESKSTEYFYPCKSVSYSTIYVTNLRSFLVNLFQRLMTLVSIA